MPIAFLALKFGAKYSPMLIFAVISFVISNIMIGLSNSLARGLSKLKLYSFSNFILGIGTIILNIIFIVGLNSGAEGLLWANTIANILTAIVIFAKLKLWRYIGKFNKGLMKKMVRYSVPLVPNSISWSIINMSDRIFLTQIIGSAANGIYAMANRFPSCDDLPYSSYAIYFPYTYQQIV